MYVICTCKQSRHGPTSVANNIKDSVKLIRPHRCTSQHNQTLMLARTTWGRYQSIIVIFSFKYTNCDHGPSTNRYTVVTIITSLPSLFLPPSHQPTAHSSQQGTGHVNSQTYLSRTRESIPTESVFRKTSILLGLEFIDIAVTPPKLTYSNKRYLIFYTSQ